MQINADWVAAIASVASAIVVAATAAAAFLQIRHVRNANEITVFLRLVDRLDSLEAEAAFAGIDEFVTRVRTDPALRLALTRDRRVADFRAIGTLLQFLEHLSTLVVMGHVTESLILAEYADSIDDLWDRLAEVVYLRRKARGPHVGAAFEHIAMRAKRYVAEGNLDRFYGHLEKDRRMTALESSARIAKP